MPELIRPSTQLSAIRQPFTVTTSDGLKLIAEVASPINESDQRVGILCLHPLPTAGGMMDSHIYKKAANR
jgi:alpha/beta superfamily hydrolase